MLYGDSFRSLVLLFAIIVACAAAPHSGHFVQFYPISQEQYDSILDMTSGKSVISEGRLINSGLRTLNDWRNSIASDLRSGLRGILNVTGFLPSDTKANKDRIEGYPLCVIKTNDVDYKDSYDGDAANADSPDGGDIDTSLAQGRAESDENYETNDIRQPVVSCVVVVKDKNGQRQENWTQQQQEQQQQQQQQEPESAQNPQSTQFLRNRWPPYYYPPYTYPSYPYGNYPAYPYYNYPYYAQSRQSTIRSTMRKPARKQTRKSVRRVTPMERKMSHGKNIFAENAQSARSSYPSYPNYLGVPYASLYGGCQGAAPHNFLVANERNDDSSSSEESSSEIAGEVGGEIDDSGDLD